ncbi:WPP domain-associated protein-like [Oryza brachyantha]|uniref:WPP domain-associated protein n=1 Tax=Oryza brachyantha TaxID=4533 RepID=J3LZN3_ORYBR|nr:WPP domain-associated protein-like [Oryza brachyantha]
MEDFFSGLDSRLRCSVKVADSIMMGLVNAAMEDAYKKSLWKDGDLERLFQKLRFAELAIVQLEWCLRFVRGEMEAGGGHDDCHEQLLDDLLETRDRIQARLDEAEAEAELAVADKDRDYMRRKHEEAASPSRREAVPDVVSGRASPCRREAEEGRVFGELKGSVDRQMARMRFRLEDARSTLTALMQKVSGEASPMARLQEAGHEGDGVKGLSGFYSMAQLLMEFQEMVLDAGAVRDSVTSSFEFMEWSVSSLKEAMDERQWLAHVEKEMYVATINGFLMEINAGFPVLNDCSSLGEKQPTTENIWEEAESLKEKNKHIQKSLKEDQCGISSSECLMSPRPATSDSKQCCYSGEPNVCHEEVERLIEENIGLEIRCELQHVLHTGMFRDLVRKLAVLDAQKLTEENDEMNIGVELLCDICSTVFKDLVSKLGAESSEHLIRSFIQDEVEAVVIVQTLNKLEGVIEMVHSEKHSKEDNYCNSPGEIKKYLEQDTDLNVLRCPAENTRSNNLERFSIINNIEQMYIMKMRTSGACEDKYTDTYQTPLEKEILSSSDNCDRQDPEENDVEIEISADNYGISDALIGSVEQPLQEKDSKEKLHARGADLNLSIPPEEANMENGGMILILNEKRDAIHSTDSNSILAEQDQFELQNVLALFTSFQEVSMNFETVACEKIEAVMLRLKDLKKQQENLVEQRSSLKTSEQIYQRAFTRRCHDLQTAEAEVDLLGDEVELLLGLLRKTYKSLDRYSPVLEHYLGIRETLRLLGEELAVRHQV